MNLLRKQFLKKLSLILAIIVILYTLTGFFLFPWIIRSQAIKRLPEMVQRDVEIDRITCNPFTLVMEVEGFRLLEDNGEVFVGLERFRGNMQLFRSLFGWAFTFKELSLDGPSLNVERNADQSFNFSDLIPEATEGPSEIPELPRARIAELKVIGGSVGVQDFVPSEPYQNVIHDITFTIMNLTTIPEDAGVFSIQALSESGGQFEFTGDLGLNPIDLSGSLSFDHVNVPKFMPYGQYLIDGRIQSGELAVSMDYSIRLDEMGISVKVDNGIVRLTDFATRAAGASKDLLSMESATVENFSADLLEGRIKVEAVKVVGASAFVHRDEEGVLNLLKAYIGPTSTEPSESEIEKELPVIRDASIQSFEFTNAKVLVLDESIGTAFEHVLEIPNATISNITNHLDQAINMEAEAGDSLKGVANVSGSATLQPLSASLQFDVREWSLNVANPYIQEYIPFELLDGYLDVSGEASAAVEEDALKDVQISADVSVSSLHVTESGARDSLLSWNELSVEGIRLVQNESLINGGTVTLSDLLVTLHMYEDGSLNFPVKQEIDEIEEAFDEIEEEVQLEMKVAGMDVAKFEAVLEKASIENGEVRIFDATHEEPMELKATGINGQLTGFSSDPDVVAPFNFEMSAMDTSEISLSGDVTFPRPFPNVNVNAAVQRLDLLSLEPYFMRFAGYQLDEGVFNLGIEASMHDQKLESASELNIHRLTLGEKTESPNAIKAPIPLALRLLKDRDGDIQLDIPIQADLADPDFSLGMVINQAVTTVIIDIVSSPFGALASLVGGSADNLEVVNFKPGLALLTEEAIANLELLSSALLDRPSLTLEISARVDPEVEVKAIGENNFREYLTNNVSVDEETEQTEEDIYRARVTKLYRRDKLVQSLLAKLPPFEEMEAELLQKYGADDETLLGLAQQRIEAVRSYLTDQLEVPSERLTVLNGDSLRKSDTGASRVRFIIE